MTQLADTLPIPTAPRTAVAALASVRARVVAQRELWDRLCPLLPPSTLARDWRFIAPTGDYRHATAVRALTPGRVTVSTDGERWTITAELRGAWLYHAEGVPDGQVRESYGHAVAALMRRVCPEGH